MDEVDQGVKLPAGSAPLSHYDRFYAYGVRGEILAEFVTGTNKRKWVGDSKSFPTIMDGGCGVITVRFQVQSRKTEAWCNGVA